MNNVISIRPIVRRTRNWVACILLSWLILVMSACQSDRPSGVAEEEVPTGDAGTDAVDDEEPIGEVSNEAAEEATPASEEDAAITVAEAPIADASPVVAIDTVSITDSGIPFCLELMSARDRALLGEPITLIVALRNCSTEVKRVRDLLGPEFGVLTVSIGHPQSEQAQIYSPPVRRDGRGRGYVDLAAGEIQSARVPVYFGRDGWQIDAPGSYTFQAEYFVDEFSMTSNAVSVTIDNPQSEADLSAARRLMSPDAATYYFLGGGNENGADELRALAAERPGSTWAGYANLGLAIASANERNNAAGQQACQTIESSLDELIEDWIIALRGYEALMDCLQENDLESEVSRTTEEFIRQHPLAEALLQSGE